MARPTKVRSTIGKGRAGGSNLSVLPEREEEEENDLPETPLEQLTKALEGKCTKTQVKKLYASRMALADSSNFDLMRRAFFKGDFISVPEGAKLCGLFVSSCLDHFEQLIETIVLAKPTTGQLHGIGTALIHAWKMAEANQADLDLQKIEDIWQTILRMSVLVDDEKIRKAYYEITKPLDMEDRGKIEPMLKIILNRELTMHMRALNHKVRYTVMQYVYRFFTIFPEDAEEMTTVVLEHLNDESVEIRSQAMMQCMICVDQCWRLLSKREFIQPIFAKIIDEMSRDRSPKVRAAVYKALRPLLTNAAAMNVVEHALKCVVPHGLADRSEKVRLACFQFLNLIRDHRFIRFYDVADVSLILACAELETDKKVQEQIVGLIQKSFLPAGALFDEWIRRQKRLIKEGGRRALVTFYQHIYTLGFITLEKAANLFVHVLGRYLYQRWKDNSVPGVDISQLSLDDSILLPEKDAGFDDDDEDMDKENQGEKKPLMERPGFDVDLAFFEAALALWKSMQKDLKGLPEKEAHVENVAFHFFEKIYAKYRETALVGVNLAMGLLFRRKDRRLAILSVARQSLTDLRNGKLEPTYYGNYVVFIWTFVPDDLLESIVHDIVSLTGYLSPEHRGEPTPKKRKGEAEKSPRECIERACQIFFYLTQTKRVSAEMFTEHAAPLRKIYQNLCAAMPNLLDKLVPDDSDEEDPGRSDSNETCMKLVEMFWVLFEMLVAAELASDRNPESQANKVLESFEQLREFYDSLTINYVHNMQRLMDNQDTQWLTAHKLFKLFLSPKVVEFVVGLAQVKEKWCGKTVALEDSNLRSPDEVCEGMIQSCCEVAIALIDADAHENQLQLVLETIKHMNPIKGMDLYRRSYEKLAKALEAKFIEWVWSVRQFLTGELATLCCHFLVFVFDADWTDPTYKDKYLRHLLRIMIKDLLAGLDQNHDVIDPYDRDFELSPLIRFCVQRASPRIREFKQLNSMLHELVACNTKEKDYIPIDNPDLDALAMRLIAALELACILDTKYTAKRKAKARGKPIEDVSSSLLNYNYDSDYVTEMKKLIRLRLQELIERDGTEVVNSEREVEEARFMDPRLLDQLKALCDYEEPTAF